MHDFVNNLLNNIHPLRLNEVTLQSFSNGISFFSKIILVGFVFMSLIYVPTLISLPSYVSQQMSKFGTLSISSNFNTLAPVYFPERDSFLVVDTSGVHNDLKQETFLITKEDLKYKLFGKEYVLKGGVFSDVTANQGSFAVLLTALIVFLFPAIVFWSYVLIWLKYFVLIVLLGSVFFTLFDLTHFKKSFKQMLNIAAYTSVIPILLEIISLPFGSDFLVPILQLIGADFYLVPLIVHSVLVVIVAFAIHGVVQSGAYS